jgi:alkylation response protein AidB-like acyl-CoA dehydrogenase
MLEKLFGGPFGEAVAGGEAARSTGEAFLAGYRAALQRLVPSLPADRKVCLCATEEGGAHPRAIQSTLKAAGSGWQLDGHKKWATGAPLADLLLVVASTGMDNGKNRLRLALVGAGQPGVTLRPMPPTPFVPEIPHAEVDFEAVFVEQLLEGDGYDQYLKPFRTIEDTFVFGAVLGQLFARIGDEPFRQRLLAVIASLEKVAAGDPRSQGLHLVLAGALELGKSLAQQAANHLDDSAKALWMRDAALLQVAGKARAARAEAAWASWRSPR